MKNANKLRVGILGSGKIGTDLLMKTQRSPVLDCQLFVGRSMESPGLIQAASMGIKISDQQLDAFRYADKPFDLVFDCTSAQSHPEHAEYFMALGTKVIDLTPSKVGEYCIPCLDGNKIKEHDNLNMVTCGGQVSVPIIEAAARAFHQIDDARVSTLVAQDSIGPATIANIDNYYATTADAIAHYSGVRNTSVELNVESSPWSPDMLTRIHLKGKVKHTEQLYSYLRERLSQLQEYAPGYSIIGTPVVSDEGIEINISVRGSGDWLASHAGNLEIINNAALRIAEFYARSIGRGAHEPANSYFGKLLGSLVYDQNRGSENPCY